jgi:hypothetical protein
MDELGAALRRISKFLRRQRVDTSTTSVSRLEDGHLFARACKLAGGHQARSTRANDQEMGSSLREHYPITMPRAKKPTQLSAKERALLNRPSQRGRSSLAKGRFHSRSPPNLKAAGARCKWPSSRRGAEHRSTAEQRDELAPPHSITSSARASSVGGISTPSALAVLRLITNSNLVGCSIGRSAGLAPLRILSTYPAARR